MKVGDLVRYTSTGDALGTGIILRLSDSQPTTVGQPGAAEIAWTGQHRGMPVRWISLQYLEVISESR